MKIMHLYKGVHLIRNASRLSDTPAEMIAPGDPSFNSHYDLLANGVAVSTSLILQSDSNNANGMFAAALGYSGTIHFNAYITLKAGFIGEIHSSVNGIEDDGMGGVTYGGPTHVSLSFYTVQTSGNFIYMIFHGSFTSVAPEVATGGWSDRVKFYDDHGHAIDFWVSGYT